MSRTVFSYIFGDGSLTDNLSYSYTGNQIQSVSGGSGTYGYDSNGNMTGDGYHGLTLEYNSLDKVSRVKSGTSAKVSYTYLADGTKVSALDASGNGLLYSGAMVFRKDGSVRSAESVGYSGCRSLADPGPNGREILRHQPVCLLRRESDEVCGYGWDGYMGDRFRRIYQMEGGKRGAPAVQHDFRRV